MSCLRTLPGRAKAILGGVLLLASAAACEEDGKTAPEKCLDPPLALYDIQRGEAGDRGNPCVTPRGNSVSMITSSSAGTPNGGSSAAGSGSGGSAGKAGGTSGNGGSAGRGGNGGSPAAGETNGGAGGA